MSNPRSILTQAIFALQLTNPKPKGVIQPSKKEIRQQQQTISARLFSKPVDKKPNSIKSKHPVHQPRGQNHR